MLIREFRPADQDVARSIILEGLGEHFGFIDASLNPDLRSINDTYLAEGHVFLVAELDGRLVGTAGLCFESHVQGRVVRMSVCQEHRRRGVARSLVSRIIEIAQARGLSELVVATQPQWDDATGLYRAMGFVPYDWDDVDVHMRFPLPVGEADRNDVRARGTTSEP